MNPIVHVLLVFLKYCLFLFAAGTVYGIIFEKERHFKNILWLVCTSVIWLMLELYTSGAKLPFLP